MSPNDDIRVKSPALILIRNKEVTIFKNGENPVTYSIMDKDTNALLFLASSDEVTIRDGCVMTARDTKITRLENPNSENTFEFLANLNIEDSLIKIVINNL